MAKNYHPKGIERIAAITSNVQCTHSEITPSDDGIALSELRYANPRLNNAFFVIL